MSRPFKIEIAESEEELKKRLQTANLGNQKENGIMALGMMLPGLISGYLQKAFGYPLFFILVCLLTIRGIIALFFIP